MHWKAEWSFLKLNYWPLKMSVNILKRDSTIKINTHNDHALWKTMLWGRGRWWSQFRLQKIIASHSKESGIQKGIKKRSIDGTYPVGKREDYGKQLRIVKFTSDAFEGASYKQHKSCIKTSNSNERKENLPMKININSKHLSPAND